MQQLTLCVLLTPYNFLKEQREALQKLGTAARSLGYRVRLRELPSSTGAITMDMYPGEEEMPGIRVLKPKGAFYVFPNISGTGKTSEEITDYLLDKAKIAVVPGSVFGNYGEGYIRISYANSYENLEIAMSNMKSALEKL